MSSYCMPIPPFRYPTKAKALYHHTYPIGIYTAVHFPGTKMILTAYLSTMNPQPSRKRRYGEYTSIP